MQLPPPLLTHRLRNPPTSSPSASLLIRLISTIRCDHTGGENRRRSSSAGYLESYHKRIHLFIFPFFLSSLDTRLCVSIREHQLDLFLLLTGYLRVNVGLIITAMTGKLAEKLPLTMSSLINTIPDNLYPEEDIPTSMNIFTNTESISHYSQMNTGKITYFPLLLRFAFWVKCDVRGRQQLSPGLKHLFALMAVALEGVFLFLNINILNIYLG